MGWALSEKAVQNPTNPGARLGFHERGFGPFTARLGSAKSARFAAVAGAAGQPVASSNRAVAVTPNAFKDGGDDDDDNKKRGGKKGGGGEKKDDDENDD
ncbi:hypothetical protein Cob_v010134 [Colletotrichum orbiculare MAFF 240422]|uniref:Cellobiose dehydrogenase-like cytochrome domain-containing protein n=1 Tax=Colletotrichum orbiculare (strain 104-T / ATCC 96160 / CBS 514.97 / LARS 414 / MAFF 240422) TaxID=1213857 RepID=A0A484FF83_COLOR|nr:hypothetical protein Cob_v010134 [Colletotrichum orbiculare MAFF 240422]